MGDTRLRTIFLWFLRLLAALWLVEGTAQWLAVLTDPSNTLLSEATPLHVTALFFFCILDCVAAVGLWLAASWGVAVWLATILGHLVVAAEGANLLAGPAAILTSDVVLVAVYATLAWLTARERRTA
jgi:hypothetical protein